MTIKDLPAALRPREKLLAHGAAALGDTELLALLLRTGLKGMRVLQLAEHLLEEFGSIAGLLNAGSADLKRIQGMGPAKRAELSAVLELALRSIAGQLQHRSLFDTPCRVKDFLRLQLSRPEHEVFAALFLDAQNQLLKMEEMFRGTLTQTSVYPREVVKRALHHNAGAVLFGHPSGAAEPSRADEFLTQTLKSTLGLVDVRVLDHLVVSHNDVVSFAERGLL